MKITKQKLFELEKENIKDKIAEITDMVNKLNK